MSDYRSEIIYYWVSDGKLYFNALLALIKAVLNKLNLCGYLNEIKNYRMAWLSKENII
ncbi:hypothetical protein [Staphylococcus ureilyticus]|uniref:Uncharacterized protein n=1 Tax=Staphylococcus ureilyticus TaxID=94138 RepID=A0AB34AK39_STAUR|nr:hypothetical protein [Staphylococcus ureilyticus]MBL0402043.1 hypothetical protein [Staphylococcus sp. S36]MDV3051687.1 hypothetical protein [Staphylococcus ureilyticus]GEQ02819.1 hypothetical protein SCO02_12600 [Staphylococcus ureilyticus]